MNFKQFEDIGMDAKKVLMVYLQKHMNSIKNYVKDGKEYSDESIEGRIHDAINYLFLLLGLITEDKTKQKKKDEMDLFKRNEVKNDG